MSEHDHCRYRVPMATKTTDWPTDECFPCMLEAKLAEAQAEVEQLKQLFERVVVKPGAYTEAVQRAEKAEAEAERLRAALERISELTHTDDCKCQAAPIEECGCQPSMREIARAALRGEGEK